MEIELKQLIDKFDEWALDMEATMRVSRKAHDVAVECGITKAANKLTNVFAAAIEARDTMETMKARILARRAAEDAAIMALFKAEVP